MRVSDRELKRIVQHIIDDAPAPYDRGTPYYSWITRVELLLATIGRYGDVFSRRLDAIRSDEANAVTVIHIDPIRGLTASSDGPDVLLEGTLGILDALLKTVDDGLLTDIEDRVASDVYGDIFAEATILLDASHLTSAAILMRVGLENGLKRRARHESMPNVDKEKTSVVNNWLWKNGVYPKGSHDAVEGWLAPGNAFAHNLPEKDAYTHRHISKALEDVRSFLGTLLV